MLKCPVCEKAIPIRYVVNSTLSEEYSCKKCGSILKLKISRRILVAFFSAIAGFSLGKVFSGEFYISFFIPSLIIIIFFFVPVSSRSFNVSLFSSMAILSTLSVWGVLFMLIELSNNKTIPSEVGIVLPVFILFLLAMRSLKVNQLRR